MPTQQPAAARCDSSSRMAGSEPTAGPRESKSQPAESTESTAKADCAAALDRLLEIERRLMLEEQFLTSASSKMWRLDEEDDVLAAAMALDSSLSVWETRWPLAAALVSPWFKWAAAAAVVLLLVRLSRVAERILGCSMAECFHSLTDFAMYSGNGTAALQSGYLVLRQRGTCGPPWAVWTVSGECLSSFGSKPAPLDWEVPGPWALHSAGEAAGLLATAVGLLVVATAGHYRKGRWIAAGGCLAVGSGWVAAGAGYLDLGQRANFWLCCARGGAYLLLATTAFLGSLRGPSCSTRQGCAVIFVLAGMLEMLGSTVYWAAMLRAVATPSAGGSDRGVWARAWVLGCAGDDGVWLGAALLAAAVRARAARGRKRSAVDPASSAQGELQGGGGGACDQGPCDDERRAHALAAEMAQGLPLAVRQGHSRRASIFSAAESGGEAGRRGAAADGARPALMCLDQLLAQAAGLDPFLRDRVRRWALLSGGRLPVAADRRRRLSLTSSFRNLFRAGGASRERSEQRTAGSELRRFADIAAHGEMRTRVLWRPVMELRQAAAELCCWEFAGEPDPSGLLDYCRQVRGR